MLGRGVDYSPARRAGIGYLIAVVITVVGGLYMCAAIAMQWQTWQKTRIWTPYENDQWKALKKQFADDPENEEVVQQLRELDVILRARFHRDRDTLWNGRYLVFVGIVVFLCAAKIVSEHHRTPNMPPPLGDLEEFHKRRTQAARWAISLMSLVIGISAGVIAVVWTVDPVPVAGAGSGAPEKEGIGPPPSDDEIAKQWGSFRGPGGRGISAYTNVPMKFVGDRGTNVLWRAQMTMPGKNSAVVWGSRVFVTGATKKSRQVFCFGTKDGKLQWKAKVAPPNPDGRPPEIHDDTGYAAPTSATDGRYVCSMFANGDVACHDMTGKEVWARNLGRPNNMYGHSASLIIWRDRLLIQFDQGDVEEKQSKLIAIKLEDGKTIYKADRPTGQSWSSPILIKVGEKYQLICCANPLVVAHDVETGKEIWRVDCLAGDGGPSPTYADGHVYACNVDSFLSKIKPDGTGDVTKDKTKVIWQGEDGLPDLSSPVANDELVFTYTATFLTCIDAKTGEMLWEHDFEKPGTSSPSLIGDKVMVVLNDGTVVFAKASRKGYEKVSEAKLGEPCETSPAFADGRIYLRAHKYLYCLGVPKK